MKFHTYSHPHCALFARRISLSRGWSKHLMTYCIAASFMSLPLVAQTVTQWNSASGGKWETTGNWDNGAPQAGVDVKIENAGSKIITVDNDTPLINLEAKTLWTSASNTLYLENTDSTLVINSSTAGHSRLYGALTIDGGHLEMKTNNGSANSELFLDGNVTVNGGSLVHSGTNGVIRFAKDGMTTTVNNGGLIETKGNIMVSPFGNTGGTMNVINGTVRTYSSFSMGYGAAELYHKNVIVNVTGSDSILDVSYLQLTQNPTDLTPTTVLTVSDNAILQFNTSGRPVVGIYNHSKAEIQNAYLSYRGVNNVDITWSGATGLDNITFTGENTFRLHSSNTRSDIAAYTFDEGERFYRLELTGDNSLWRTTGTTTIGSDGVLHVFDTSTATINADLDSDGHILLDNSTVKFVKNVNVTDSGSIKGLGSAVLEFQKDIAIESTNALESNLNSTTFRFSGGIGHELDLTNSGFTEEGLGGMGQSNFNLGILSIETGNSLTLSGGSGVNALYIGILDLTGWDVGGGLMTTLTQALDLSGGINIYYNQELAGNAYLGGNDYNLWSGGQLIAAIPEASTIYLILTGIAFVYFIRRKSTKSA